VEPLRKTLALICFGIALCLLYASFSRNAGNRLSIYQIPEYFNGKFNPDNTVVGVGEAVAVSFTVTPSVDTPDTTIQIILPGSLVVLVDGSLSWQGNIKKGETVSLSFKVKLTVETVGYIRAKATCGYMKNEYQARLQSPNAPTGTTVPATSTFPTGPEFTLPAAVAFLGAGAFLWVTRQPKRST